jgi:hypothetical protein
MQCSLCGRPINIIEGGTQLDDDDCPCRRLTLLRFDEDLVLMFRPVETLSNEEFFRRTELDPEVLLDLADMEPVGGCQANCHIRLGNPFAAKSFATC